ncbi:MAG: hypothetical protein PUE21_00755, partial [Lachnospiraceae bacterium]|nr:hypothetical protein [Lachnospiraceae bacterium]
LNKLVKENDINTFFSKNEGEFLTMDFKSFINDLLAQKELRLADVVRDSGQGEYVYKVFNGTRKPSRNIIIGISIGMKLTINETQFLLRLAKQAIMDPRDRRDSVLIFAIKEKYDIIQTNNLLIEMNQDLL